MFKNILQYLENTSPRLPQKVAFSDGDMNVTFSQVQSISQSLGTALCQGGYTREPVLLLLDRSPLAVAATFGVIYAGCYYVVLDPEMPPARMGQIADTMKARVLLYDAKNAKKASTLVENGYFSGELLPIEPMYETSPDTSALAKVRKAQLDTDPIYVVFTSGSTGVPKGVVMRSCRDTAAMPLVKSSVWRLFPLLSVTLIPMRLPFA